MAGWPQTVRGASASATRAAIETAIERMKPALVRIQVVTTDYREGREMKSQAVGSGAIISKEGYLITNHHVAGHAAHLVCTLWNREEIDAELVGTDPLTDVAVLKLRPPTPRQFAYAKFGDSSQARVGDSVLAMGSPMALSQSVTLGILSNLEMMMPKLFGGAGRLRLDGEDVGSLVRWFGHDAAIYGGNSGGPLVNLKGEIIGINEISFGLSGAIPGNLARSVAEELIAHKRVRRSWLGVDVQPLFKDTKETRGVLVSGVIKDSPASAAGLQAGDLIVRLAGVDTNVRFEEQMPDFMRLVTGLPLGKATKVVALRGGKEMSFTLVPVERGELNPEQEELKEWGMTARDISFLTAKEKRLTSQAGVLVTSVRPGGPAGEAKPGLESETILTKVNGQEITDLAALKALTRQLTEGKKVAVPAVVTFEKETRRYLTVVKLGLGELRDPGLEVAKAWLPVETEVLSRDIAEQVGRPDLKGFYITLVYPGTTAAQAGLKVGDFIVALDGEKLTAARPEDQGELAALIRQYNIGSKVELSVVRDKQPLKVSVELARSPKLPREMKKYRNEDFEFTARDIAFFDIAAEQWSPSQQGVLVEDVRSGSWAELGSLSVDDLITEVNGQPVENVEALKRLMEQVSREKKPFVEMRVLRGIHSAYLQLEPTWKQ